MQEESLTNHPFLSKVRTLLFNDCEEMGAGGSVPAGEAAAAKDIVVELPTKFTESSTADAFAKEMYLSTPKVDALTHVLSEEGGREAFMKFLQTEYASERIE